MVLCGIAITGFSVRDVRRRDSHARPPVAVAAGGDHDLLHLRRVHRRGGPPAATTISISPRLPSRCTAPSGCSFETFNRLVTLAVALAMVYYGYLNFLDGFKSLRMPSMTPLASLYAAIPMCGALVALFIVEQLVNGWKNGFADTDAPTEGRPR